MPRSATPSSVTPSSVRSQRMSLRRLAATTATVIAGSVLVAAPHASAATPDARPARPVAVRTSHTSHTAHTSHTSHLAARAATAQAAFGMQVLAEAARHDGAPYSYGAAGPSSFDCSGFTSYVYRQLGISLPRTSYAQYATTRHLPASLAVPGDLIFLDLCRGRDYAEGRGRWPERWGVRAWAARHSHRLSRNARVLSVAW